MKLQTRQQFLQTRQLDKNKIYTDVIDSEQPRILTGWIIIDKEVEGKIQKKATLVARGFQDEYASIVRTVTNLF